ncbi:MAG: hypothetical protein J7518_10880 [Nocardioidaceae bacterium]|nr:hypothetical protein [Nocardioidaceae bacterium]
MVVVFGLLLALAGLPGWIGGPAVAATGVNDGSDWGPSGLLTSDSAVTVRWDNTGNPSSDVVFRDGRQGVPHTGGKTYDDIRSSIVAPYFSTFGADNGLGGLEVRVSQTRNLVNQSVAVEISGAKGGATIPGGASYASFQIFQCWGGLKANGSPDPSGSAPDPATCQVGAGDAVANRAPNPRNGRYLGNDPLAGGGDWEKFLGQTGDHDVPFTALTGEKSGSTTGSNNQFFNPTTTNEVSRVNISAGGDAATQFEVQTSVEAPGLGCGRRVGQASIGSCWLVIVPRLDDVLATSGPISPSLWAQRLQVRLGLRDILPGCPGGQARSLTNGSELLSLAAASWVPGLCKAENIALGYTVLGDEVARNQLASGASSAALTTRPAVGAVHVPMALAAPVFAYSLTYQVQCEPPYTAENVTTKCGYGSLAEFEKDLERVGQPVRDLRLDARLVAKLLTQSYQRAIISTRAYPLQDWMANRPASVAYDPEFQRLNPSLAHLDGRSVKNLIAHLLVEGTRSDAASEVWRWILADPDARAFLNGCPDHDGMVVNPFYSTRTYQGCESQKTALAAKADADRKAQPVPDSYVDQPVSYPPDGSPFPLPGWQESVETVGDVKQLPYSVFEFLPRVDNMTVAARDTAIGYLPRLDDFCYTAIDGSCLPAPGKWRDLKTRQATDRMGIMAIVGSAAAATYQLPTAKLCDSDGKHCVGATTDSMRKAAARFVDSGVEGAKEPGSADYAAGAYPLTMPVFAAVAKTISADQKHVYGRALKYVTTAGQKAGFAPGNLPPGYAPLTSALQADARAGIATLLAATDPKPAGHGTQGDGDGSDPDTAGSGTPGSNGGDVPVASAPVGAPAGGNVVSPSTQFVNASAGTESFPRWILPFGLGIALVTGLIGPLLRLRSTVKIG